MGEPVYRVRAAECNGGAYIEGASEAGRTMAEAVRPQPPTGAREPLAVHAAEVWKDTGSLPTREPRTPPTSTRATADALTQEAEALGLYDNDELLRVLNRTEPHDSPLAKRVADA